MSFLIDLSLGKHVVQLKFQCNIRVKYSGSFGYLLIVIMFGLWFLEAQPVYL